MTIEPNIVITRKQLKVFVWIAFLSLCSCQGNKKREETTKLVLEWTGKEIKFPENVPCYISGIETLTEHCDECFRKEYKILLYVDSTGCSDCRLQLYEWIHLMEEADSMYQGRVGFLLFFQPKSMRTMISLFAREWFDCPVFMDFKGTINSLNCFPQEMEYQCFLLDRDNKVIAIGNPIMNRQIWELYQSHIKDENKSELQME